MSGSVVARRNYLGKKVILIIESEKRGDMKNSIWMGISMSVLAGIVQASDGEIKEQKVVISSESGEQAEVSVDLIFLGDGSVLLQREDGSNLVIPKSTVDEIKKLAIKSRPKLEKSTPCVAAAKTK